MSEDFLALSIKHEKDIAAIKEAIRDMGGDVDARAGEKPQPLWTNPLFTISVWMQDASERHAGEDSWTKAWARLWPHIPVPERRGAVLAEPYAEKLIEDDAHWYFYAQHGILYLNACDADELRMTVDAWARWQKSIGGAYTVWRGEGEIDLLKSELLKLKQQVADHEDIGRRFHLFKEEVRELINRAREVDKNAETKADAFIVTANASIKAITDEHVEMRNDLIGTQQHVNRVGNLVQTCLEMLVEHLTGERTIQNYLEPRGADNAAQLRPPATPSRAHVEMWVFDVGKKLMEQTKAMLAKAKQTKERQRPGPASMGAMLKIVGDVSDNPVKED
jgi:hypothetical protein